MMLSVIIPAQNEAEHCRDTISALAITLQRAQISHEILVVNDHSTDHTAAIVSILAREWPQVRLVTNASYPGFGSAVRAGLASAAGDAVTLVMADGSDHPEDVVTYYRALQQGVDCVFGSRFIRGAHVVGYPWHKLWLNRLANTCIRILFQIRYNDVTNAFKCYRREVIEGIQPLVSRHFNLTVELPLKAVIRGYSYTVVPIRWRQRKHGLSKLKIKEMGSRYLFIVLSVFLEKHLVSGDYHRRTRVASTEAATREEQPVSS